MMICITSEAKIKMSPVSDHLHNGFLNSAMRPFDLVDLILLSWSTEDNVNMLT